MKELLFNFGSPLRVYLTDVEDVYLDAWDVAAAAMLCGDPEEFLREHPASFEDKSLPKVYSEKEFFRIARNWERNEGGCWAFLTGYLLHAVPVIRTQIAMIAEEHWQKDDKVRQLEQDLEMNLAERRKAENQLAAVLNRFVRVCADNGVMSRLLLEISSQCESKMLRNRIVDTLKNNSALNPT